MKRNRAENLFFEIHFELEAKLQFSTVDARYIA